MIRFAFQHDPETGTTHVAVDSDTTGAISFRFRPPRKPSPPLPTEAVKTELRVVEGEAA